MEEHESKIKTGFLDKKKKKSKEKKQQHVRSCEEEENVSQ